MTCKTTTNSRSKRACKTQSGNLGQNGKKNHRLHYKKYYWDLYSPTIHMNIILFFFCEIFCKFKSKTLSDWRDDNYGLADQKLYNFQMLLKLEKSGGQD